MLFKVVFLPSNFTSLPEDSNYHKLFYDKIIGILSEFLDNCIILVDGKRNLLKEWYRAVHSWPQAQRTKVQTIIKQLERKNRFVSISNISQYLVDCKEPCQYCLNIAKQYTHDIVLATGSCFQCFQSSILSNATVVDVSEYSQSLFSETRRESLSYCLGDSDWDKKTFEEKILIPIFRYAKWLDFYDRMIGDALIEGSYVKDRFPKNYRKTIEWILETFHREALFRVKTREIKIYCEINLYRLKIPSCFTESQKEFARRDALEKAKKTINGFKDEMLGRGFSLIIELNKIPSEKALKMVHDRYIRTDQVALQIGRGFDLINKSSRIRDVTITYCRDFEKLLKS